MGAVTRVGGDVGQRVDPSTLCVAEERTVIYEPPGGGERRETEFRVRFLQRLPVQTPYPAVAARFAEVVRGVEEASPRARPWALFDVTGVGRPVFELIVDALRGTRAKLCACTFTATDRLEGGYGSAEIRLGKAFMVSNLQALLQTGRIRLPETDEARALAQELLDFELRVTDSATLQAGAFRVGRHDDLVTALGLATLPRSPFRRPWTLARPLSIPTGLESWNPDGGTHATWVRGPTVDDPRPTWGRRG